jgi:hypothetical protein
LGDKGRPSIRGKTTEKKNCVSVSCAANLYNGTHNSTVIPEAKICKHQVDAAFSMNGIKNIDALEL